VGVDMGGCVVSCAGRAEAKTLVAYNEVHRLSVEVRAGSQGWMCGLAWRPEVWCYWAG